MKNSEYWKQRFVQLERSQTANSAKTTKEVQDIYRSAQAEIEKQIYSWYGRFAKNNGITMAQARQLLKADELDEFHWSVEEYIKRGKECAVNNQKWFKELENASAKFHITRLEALETNLKANFEILAAQKDGIVSETVKGAYKTGYYKSCFEVQRGFNVGFDIGQIDEDKLEKLIRKPWAADGYNFSERIWRDKNKLLNLAHQEITKSAMLGSSPDKAIKAIAQAMGTSEFNARRLVMTESSYFHALGEKKMYTEFGYEKYEVIASHSAVRKTCELCAEMDGKIFLTRDFEPGLNANPFHPNCHCTTVPYFDDFNEGEERFARGEDGKGYYVPSDMKYSEWKERFVGGGEKGTPISDFSFKSENNPEIKQAEVKSSFIPAETIQEAEEYAGRYIETRFGDKTFKGIADFKGVSLEYANDINRALSDVFDRYDIPKISGIKVIDPNSAKGKKIFTSADAVMAYSPVEHGVYLNKSVLKSPDTLAAYNKQAQQAWDTVMNNIDSLTGSQRETALRYKNAGRSLVGDGSAHDYFVHEMGHHIQWEVFDANTNNAVGSRMSQYAGKISGYAAASKSEYFAESFAAFEKGEFEKLDPDFVAFLRGKSLDKSVKSGIINNTKVFIHTDKINKFCLKPDAKHANDFFNVGYTTKDYDLLYNDIISNFDENSIVDVVVSDSGVVKFSVFMDLGVGTKKRFRTVWQKDTAESAPRFITAHRED